MRYAKTIVIAGLYGHLFFLFVLILMHFIRPDKSIRASFVSEYAVGHDGWLMTLGFFGIAIGASCLITGLVNSVKASKTAKITLGIWCVCTFLFSIFITDLPGTPPTPQGLIHGFSALIALLCLSIATIAWGFTFNKTAGWHHMAKISWFLGLMSVVLFIVFLLSPPSVRGLTERLLLVCDTTWLILINRQLYINITTSNLTSTTSL